ncbi:unnamed protein product [Spirodela intermedia]|uniref:F-box domain-containing protein n=1 Tax=Spirodela intermedia TaxID=51605 RepID=A0A7I8JGV6_SPIIN|nr:unnamed protein product [Spirodela intermedia]CAA6668642.1 unnamed protein product [Spirodela intermedia]
MESRIWRRLPEKLLERVLAFLPPAAFFRARAVCRRWYALLFSDAFLELQLRLSPAAGGSSSSSTTSRRASSTPASPRRRRRPPPWPPLRPRRVPLAAPPLRRRRPRTFTPPPPPVASSAGSPSARPQAATPLQPALPAGVAAAPLPPPPPSPPWVSPSARPPSSFFCMSHSPFAVLSYDIAGDVWKKLQAPMKRFLRSPSLVELAGGVAMVAAVEKRKLAVPRSVRVWGLKEGGWAEVERMPAAVHEEFAAEERGRGLRRWGGGTVAITIRGSGAVLVFELRRREWRWLPACPLLRNGAACGGGGGLRGFAFEPRLATPALGLLQAAPPTPFPFQG